MSLTAHSQARRSQHNNGQGTVKSPPGFPPAAVRSHQARLNSSRHLQPTAGSDRFFSSCLHRQGRCSQHQGYHCHIRLPAGCCSQRSAPQLLPTGDISQALVLQVSTNRTLKIFPPAQNFKNLEVINMTLPKAIVPSGKTLRMSQVSSNTAPQRYRSGDRQGWVPPCWRRQGGLELAATSCSAILSLAQGLQHWS